MNDEINNKRSRAEEELWEMWKKSTSPQIPPFVKMPTPEPPEKAEEKAEPPKNPSEPPKKRGIGGLLGQDIFKFLDFKSFELNSDRMLILLMLVLLSGEDSDNILLFALAYIML